MTVDEKFKLAVTHHLASRYAEAAALYRDVLAARPELASCSSNLGSVLTELGELDEAIRILRHAVTLKPDFAGAWYNLGRALERAAQFDAAIDAYRKALSLDPNYADAVNNLANALLSAGDLHESIATYRKALALRPNFAWAHWNLGIALLGQGDYPNGWREFEWRLKVAEPGHPNPKFPQPRWDGSPLSGKRILLWTEQGFGDMIQFVRYVSVVLERGGRPILSCPAPLIRLFARIPDVEIVDRTQPLPEFEIECPLMSLPLVLNTTPDTIPATVPYLPADPEKFRPRFANDGRKRVGLAWSGRSKPDPRRSIPSSELAPLATLPGIQWINLQRPDPTEPPPTPLPGFQLTDWTPDLTDFADTADLIHHLDYVVTIDTATAHLAGAMGKPVLTFLPFSPDWRWRLHETKTPWYPTMRLFRQPAIGQWRAPIDAVAGALS